MLNKVIQAIRCYRGPLPDRYRLPSRYAPAVFISSYLIIGGVFTLLIAAYFGIQLLTGANDTPPGHRNAADDTLIIELRANSYAEVATAETSMYRLSLDILRQATSPAQREAALRGARQAREQAIRHLNEAQAIALPPDKQPDVVELRARIDELDRQLASIPGSGSH